MLRRLLLFGLIVLGVWWFWTRWRPAHNYRLLSGRLENALNNVLSRNGVTDRQVTVLISKERSQWGMLWVQTERRVELPAQATLPSLVNQLSATARSLGCQVRRRNLAPVGVDLEIRKGPCLLQRLLFAAPPLPRVLLLPQTPVVAFVIDDVAYDLAPMDRYAALGVPLTFAILPRDKHCKDLATKAHDHHFGVILHLPMEPIDLAHNNPGGAALYLSMTPSQLHRQFEKDVASVPYIQGINNHMGSAFTSDAAKMRLVMHWVKESNLFFLDSHTAPHSVVPQVAEEVGVPCLVNDTFLDNEDTLPAIEHQLDLVLKLALRNKRTVAIGHYRRKFLVEALANKIPEFQAHHVTLVTLPSLYGL
jgi:hypothetical protein